MPRNSIIHRLGLGALAVGIALLPSPLRAQNACQLPADLQPASKCVDAAGNLVVGPSAGPNCGKVVFDKDFTGAQALKKVTVEAGGEAYIPDESRNIELNLLSVAGLFQAGTQECPIGLANPANQVTLTFTGERPCPSPSKCDGFNKGVEVDEGGIFRLFGVKGVPASEIQSVQHQGISWTHLSQPAGPEGKYGPDSGALAPVVKGGGQTLFLDQDVTQGEGAWRKGDWIAVATTGFSSVETEIVKIADLRPGEQGGSIVELVQSLKHYHFGGTNPGDPSLDTFNHCSGFNYGVDERAEVALLSRNIKLTARIEPGDNNLHWGGELHFHHGYKEVSVQGVEIEKFGKDQLASYPVHFHMNGDVAALKPLINANSIHHSYNKCITVHSTSNVTIENNSCTRIVGHIFYQEIGDEKGVRYHDNLGLGAMSHRFDVSGETPQKREDKIKNLWWAGDNLAQKGSPDYNGYDGFNIVNTDNQKNPVRGACTTPSDRGLIVKLNPNTPEHPGDCKADEVYFEPASGFWIIHPGTELVGNSIGGCQDVGRGYWYVPPQNRPNAGVPPELTKLSQEPVGLFKHNRVHGCYSGLYGEREFGVLSEQLFPRDPATGKNIVGTFEGLISTRNRDRGVWLRPVWTVLKDGRFATNRNSVTLVSSGGLDGNAPGVWAMLEDSVLIGISQNNVDRWGPCPQNTADLYDCVEPNKPAMSAPNSAKGFPSPFYNLSGYMIYDGPVLIFRDRFAHFNHDITLRLTNADKSFLASYTNFPNGNSPNVYEGDAALGWFQNNQSAYPTGTQSRELSWENVDFRHQIYTEKVNLGDFQDGDRNTAIIDLDGTLTGFHVVDAEGNSVPGGEAISLNNLEFNHASNSVDECLAEGAQDTLAEGRPTSLISAGHYATLEFQALFPTPLPEEPSKQLMTFHKDQKEFGENPEMKLTSRNGLGVWEPKVASGYGYTVQASTCTKPVCSPESGIPSRVSVGLTDAVKPGVSADNPFYVRVGICYTNNDAQGSHPTNNFTIRRGYRSWGGNGTDVNDAELQQYFNVLVNRFDGEQCHILDFQNPPNLNALKGCPATGVSAVPTGSSCPAPSTQGVDQAGKPACIYPTSTLNSVASIDLLKNGDAPDLTKYFYDEAKGMLFFYVAQDIPNAIGPSPLGTCPGPNCPQKVQGESYYACPAAGCLDYVVELNDPNYEPGPSKCSPYPDYEQEIPAEELFLAHLGKNEPLKRHAGGGKDDKFPHYISDTEPLCPLTVVEGASESDGGLPGQIKFAASGEVPAPVECPAANVADFQGGACSLNKNSSGTTAWFYLGMPAALALLFSRQRKRLLS